jgi:phytoene dehydrogenase-like protein
LKPWWDLRENNEGAYEARKTNYTVEIINQINHLIPGIDSENDLILSGTPVTFQTFTHRKAGWVGGFPQTSLFRVQKPHLSRHMWMVGDSIFPGQSVPAVALGGLRVAQSVLEEFARDKTVSFHPILISMDYQEC